MQKSEYARMLVERYLEAAGGPVVIRRDLIDRAGLLTDDGDPRWIGVALRDLNDEGRLVYPGCAHTHQHDDRCTVSLVAS